MLRTMCNRCVLTAFRQLPDPHTKTCDKTLCPCHQGYLRQTSLFICFVQLSSHEYKSSSAAHCIALNYTDISQ